MCWALRFGFKMGVVLIDAFQVHLELLPNFHNENLVAFRFIFVAKIQQHFSLDASQPTKCYYHQAFDMRIRQWGCPISWRKSCRVSHLVYYGASARFRVYVYGMYRHACTMKRQKTYKVSSKLMHVAYMGKPMSLSDMDHDNHTLIIVHTIQHEYAPTTIALSTCLHYKVKSSHDQRKALTQR